MDKRYCVRFIRCDGAVPPVEKYYYANKADAEEHFNLFKEENFDFKEMYERIQLITIYDSGNLFTILKEIHYT